jgi:hypothetical protein
LSKKYSPRSAAKSLEETYQIPAESILIYSHLWGLENWLREMVYVELKSFKGSTWSAGLKDVSSKVIKAKSLIHMSTSERGPLSYFTLGELWEVISSASNWPLFEKYFPPKHLTEGKVTELMQIRHRVAHCRNPHRDDLPRVQQFLRDVDKSFWRFTTSYNDQHPITPPSSDPVASSFIDYDQYPWIEVENNTWTRLGRKQPYARYWLTIDWTVRPWVNVGKLDPAAITPKPGILYDVNFQGLDQRYFDYQRLLQRTKSIHDRCIHILLDEIGQSFRVTLPSVLGHKVVINTVKLIQAEVLTSLRHSARLAANSANSIADQWPEYVLGPMNALTFLCKDMPARFFAA